MSRTGPRARQPLRIAQVAPPVEAVPPTGYGGTERIVDELVHELDRRGHQVTTFASGDLRVPGPHVPTVPRALRPIGLADDPTSLFRRTAELVLELEDDFDLIHAHLGPWNLELARRSRISVVSTFHKRLDVSWARHAFDDGVRGLVSVSRDQARVHPTATWTVIHHGLTFRPPPRAEAPGRGLLLRRPDGPRRGVLDAIEIALMDRSTTPGRVEEAEPGL